MCWRRWSEKKDGSLYLIDQPPSKVSIIEGSEVIRSFCSCHTTKYIRETAKGKFSILLIYFILVTLSNLIQLICVTTIGLFSYFLLTD